MQGEVVGGPVVELVFGGEPDGGAFVGEAGEDGGVGLTVDVGGEGGEDFFVGGMVVEGLLVVGVGGGCLGGWCEVGGDVVADDELGDAGVGALDVCGEGA